MAEKDFPSEYSILILLPSAENSSPGHMIFFLVPIGIQISINMVLFVITAIHCNRVKSEILRMQTNDNCEQKKRRFVADKAMWVLGVVNWLSKL